MKLRRMFGIALILAPVVLSTPDFYLVAQAPAQATVHGSAKDPAGIPLKDGEVRLTTDKTSDSKSRKYQYTFPIGADGTYKGAGIAPGDYVAFVFRGEKSIDFQMVVFKAGDDKTVDFDMTREEYLKSLTPEDRKILEEAKKKNAGVMAENAKISNVNQVLTQARLDEKSGKADEAVKNLTPLTTVKADEPIVWAALGEAQLASADAAVTAAKAAKTPTNDPAILQKYTDAAASYQKAIDLNVAKSKPNPEITYSSYLNQGQALGRSGKTTEAAAAYENAAKATPANAGAAYYNEAATFFNANKLVEANAAADKSIAADPKRGETYYIKASSLIPNATMDPKTNKFVLPPGCLEAYQTYLELEPNGRHSQDVKELLANLGQSQKSSFKAKK